MRRPIAIVALVCTAALVAGCGDDDTAATGSAPTADTSAGSTTTAPEPQDPATDAGDAPERIVSLSPTGTEMLFAVGAGEQVVAVDDQSDFPPEAPVTDLSGYEPNVEAIIAFEPDLVVATDLPEDVASGIEAVGAEVLDLPAATVLDETYEQIENVGIATGHEDEAADVVAAMRAEVDELVATVPPRPEPLTYYHELDDQLYSITSQTFIGQLYALVGLTSVADAADPDGDLGGYPQLSPEFIVEADPDFVFLADTECCAQDAETLAARPGFADLRAVAEGNVVELSDDVASRWGPRVVELLRTIIGAVTG